MNNVLVLGVRVTSDSRTVMNQNITWAVDNQTQTQFYLLNFQYSTMWFLSLSTDEESWRTATVLYFRMRHTSSKLCCLRQHMVVSTHASHTNLTLTEVCNQQRAELQTLHQWVQSAATSGMWLLFCNVLKITHNTM